MGITYTTKFLIDSNIYYINKYKKRKALVNKPNKHWGFSPKTELPLTAADTMTVAQLARLTYLVQGKMQR